MDPDDLKHKYQSAEDLALIRYAKIRHSLELAAIDAVKKLTTSSPDKVTDVVAGLMDAVKALNTAEDAILSENHAAA